MDEAHIQIQELIDDVKSTSSGEICKVASSIASEATKTQVREESFQMAVIPFDNIENDDLDYQGDSEESVMWFEMEPSSRIAYSIPYGASPVSFPYSARKYAVLIAIVTTDEATKNINHLRTYKTDLRQTVQDNMVRDLHTALDTRFLATIRRHCGSEIDLSDPARTVEHRNVNLNAAFSRQTNKRIQSFLTDRQLANGVRLVNQRTANELLGWYRDEVGGDKAEDILFEGLGAATGSMKIFKVPYITTIKNNLVFNGEVFSFAPKAYLGRALMLEDIKVTVKREYDMIRMRAQWQVGLTIGNTRSVQLNKTEIGA